MIVLPYKDDLKDAWDSFIWNDSENGTIFHTQKFLSYHEEKKFKDCSILIKSKDKIISVFPANITNNLIISHLGSSYGGIILKKFLKLKEIETIIKLIFSYYLEFYQEYGVKIILSENFFLTNDKIEFFLNKLNMYPISKDISTVVDVEEYFNLRGIRKSTKQYLVSKRFNRLNIEYTLTNCEKEMKEAYDLLFINLKNKYNKKPTHSYSELLILKKLFTNKIYFFIAKKNNKVVATYITFELTKEVLHCFYIAKLDNIENITSIGLVNFILEYSKNKYKYFNFGISSRDNEIKYWIHNYKEQYSKLFLTRNTWHINNLKFIKEWE